MITAAVFLAQTGTARGDINRFTSPQRLVGYIGLDPRVRQSGNGPGHTGRISKEGAAAVRHVLVEAALTAVRSPGPLRAFYQRIRARRGRPIAIVATARKLAKLFWHLLIREQNYASRSPRRSPRRSARSNSKPAIPDAAPATTTPSTASNAESSSARSPNKPKLPTKERSPTGNATPAPPPRHPRGLDLSSVPGISPSAPGSRTPDQRRSPST